MTPLEQIPVTRLLPQQPPFVMIDALVGFSERQTATRLAVRRDNLFVEHGQMSAYGLLENMAQTCAARLGYASYILNKPVKVGFIGAVREGKFHRMPRVGETLVTRIEVIEEIMGLTLVNAKVFSQEELLAECQMKIAVREDEKVEKE